LNVGVLLFLFSAILTFSFWRQKEKDNKKKKHRLKTEAGFLLSLSLPATIL